jgi:hypothetical protein
VLLSSAGCGLHRVRSSTVDRSIPYKKVIGQQWEWDDIILFFTNQEERNAHCYIEVFCYRNEKKDRFGGGSLPILLSCSLLKPVIPLTYDDD